MLSNTAKRVLLRLRAMAFDTNSYRARERQIVLAQMYPHWGIRELAVIYRDEMAYTPGDRAREEYAIGDL